MKAFLPSDVIGARERMLGILWTIKKKGRKSPESHDGSSKRP
jgi:hypothetical protein